MINNRREMIKCLQALEDGKRLEFKCNGEWTQSSAFDIPNFGKFEYRVAEERVKPKEFKRGDSVVVANGEWESKRKHKYICPVDDQHACLSKDGYMVWERVTHAPKEYKLFLAAKGKIKVVEIIGECPNIQDGYYIKYENGKTGTTNSGFLFDIPKSLQQSED